MAVRHFLGLLAVCLLAVLVRAQTSAEVTGQAQTGAATTAAPTTSSGPVATGDTATYAAETVNASDEYLSHAVGVVIADNTAWTVMTWVYFDDTDNAGLCGDSDGKPGIKVKTNATQLTFRTKNAVDKSRAMADISGAWHSLAVTCDGAATCVFEFYLDGVSLGTQSNVASELTIKTVMSLGTSTLEMDGDMAWMGVWGGRELIEAEILEIHNLGGPNLQYADLTVAMKANLASFWPHEEESGTRFDAHGAIDLTDNNTVGRAEVVYP